MAAPEGNQFWKLRSKHGKDKLFASPQLLWDAACEYFEWCDENPWIVHTAVKAGEHFGETVEAPTARPYTLKGLCIYLDCGSAFFRNFKQTATQDYQSVIERIEEAIYTQKFEGAAVGAFNANLISRELGLADKKEIEKTVKTVKFTDAAG